MPPPPPSATIPDGAASPDTEEERPPSPTVPAPLKRVQDTLLSLEYTLRNLSAVAADVQPDGQDDPPEGRVGRTVNEVIRLLAQLDEQKDDVEQNIPKDVLDDIDNNRNPNRSAKARVENTAVQNQFVHSQLMAVQSYRGFLREALVENFPDMAPFLDEPRMDLTKHAGDVVRMPSHFEQPTHPI
ncbi:hypothetical protein M407DRAFT_189231 [Tulasnella calospora MUT 4182]|uniref:Mediator of RNA polymerase II transcription subunit 10 n=1 Tax=Tulasnella calospora MUT 4182 TaxID=1051891 RepID=A0A0C3QBA8_9AGAM|nr:hypothetical protein M407DRAFT_189231 [Tulasnella calospora MUT 4182]